MTKPTIEQITSAVFDLDYAAWEHGFRSTPGGQGESLYVASLSAKRQQKRVALFELILLLLESDTEVLGS
jgi:hypothetical protein